MNWTNLPIDLRIMILSFRYQFREDAQRTIVRNWKKFQAPKKVAYDLVIEEREGLPMSVVYLDTARIMKYCVKVLSGKENHTFWRAILEELDYELWENEYADGPGAKNYLTIQNCYFDLSRIFGYEKRMCMD
jgi:hypothetical protein